MLLHDEVFKEVLKIEPWKLPKSLKKEAMDWMEALKSNKYKQGVGSLCSYDNKFCCLGVLSDLQGCEWVTKAGEEGFFPKVNGHVLEDECYLSEELANKFNMTSQGIIVEVLDFKNERRYVSLASLNDRRIPFTLIADIIGLAIKGGYVSKTKAPEFKPITSTEE